MLASEALGNSVVDSAAGRTSLQRQVLRGARGLMLDKFSIKHGVALWITSRWRKIVLDRDRNR